MRGHREELDDTIDRVAASMTFAPADSTLAARVAHAIRADARVTFPWLRAAVAVAGVALAVAVVTMWRNEPAERVVTTAPQRPERVVPAAEQPQPALADRPASGVYTPPQAPSAVRAGRIAGVGSVPQIAALPLPEVLEVEELQTPSLTIAPVDLAPLEMASLAVAELDGLDDRRE